MTYLFMVCFQEHVFLDVKKVSIVAKDIFYCRNLLSLGPTILDRILYIL